MLIRTIFFVPFISLLFYRTINFKSYFILNSVVFIYLLVFLIKSRPGFLFKLPSSYKYLFAAIFISLLSYLLSPVKEIISLEYINFISGFIIYFLVINIDEKLDFKYTYPFIIALLSLGIYDSFINSGVDVASVLKNSNTLAFILIMLIGILISEKKYYFSIFLFAALIATKSIAAMLSIMSVSFYYGFKNRKNIDIKNNSVILVIMIILFGFLIYNIDTNSIYDRLRWWKVCLRMHYLSPIFGWGYSSFAYTADCFISDGLRSSYAHNYFLETLVENGIIFSALWFYFLYLSVKSANGFLKYSLIAALIHSFFDFGINTSCGLWFFMFFLGILAKDNMLVFRLGDEYSKYKKYLVSFALILLISWFFLGFRYFNIEKINNELISLNNLKSYDTALGISQKALEKYPSSIDIALRRIEILEGIYAEKKDTVNLEMLARSIEYSLLLNPYYKAGYKKLESIYKYLGDYKSLDELKNREKKYIYK